MTFAHQIEQKFAVRIGVFDAAKVSLNYRLTNETYQMRSDVTTDGLFGKLYAFQAEYASNGTIDSERFLTQLYRYRSQTKSHVRTKELHFDRQGNLLERMSSKDGQKKTVTIKNTDFRADSYDLQTVFSQMIRQFEQNSFCALEKIVFDGKRSYRVVIEDDGDSLIDDEDGIYRGKVWKCSMFLKKIKAEDGDMLWEATAERPIYFYIARDASTNRPFLARVEIEKTPLGRLTVYTTQLKFKD
jgi:hypothetical protein